MNQHFTRQFVQNPHRNALLNTLLLLLPPVLVFSSLSYHFIEKPFMKLRVRYLRPLPHG